MRLSALDCASADGLLAKADDYAVPRARDLGLSTPPSVRSQFSTPRVARLSLTSASMDALLQDLRYAMRMVAKSPGTTAIALLTIGIATGANATVFGFVSALLLRPAPGVADPGSLVAIYTSDYSSGPYGTSSYPDYLSLKSDVPAFAQMAALQDDTGVVQRRPGRWSVFRWRRSRATISRSWASGQPMGRLLTPADARPDAPPAVVSVTASGDGSLPPIHAIVDAPLTTNGRTLHRLSA